MVLGICTAPPRAGAAGAPGDSPGEADRAIYEQAFALAEESDFGAARTTALQGRQARLNTFFLWLDLTNQRDEEARRDTFWTLDAFLAANPD